MAKAHPVPHLRPDAPLVESARAIIRVRVAEMFSFEAAVGDSARDVELHDMRIAAKRLRYTLEMFRALLGDEGPPLIDVVKTLQARIGDIHDADVLSETARLHLAAVAQRQVDALVGAAKGALGPALDPDPRPDGVASMAGPSRKKRADPSEEERVRRVYALLDDEDDARTGLAVLLARTQAGRERDSAALLSWWAAHGGAPLRARLDALLIDATT